MTICEVCKNPTIELQNHEWKTYTCKTCKKTEWIKESELSERTDSLKAVQEEEYLLDLLDKMQ